MSTLIEIGQGINMLKVAFPNYQPDVKLTADLWVSALGDLPGETLKAAIMQCMVQANRAFAPSVGEIRGAAMKLNAQASGIPTSWAAYEEASKMPENMISRRLIVENGENIIEERKITFSHPLVEKVAKHLGWPRTFPTDMPAADRSQFIKAYEAEFDHAIEEAGRLKQIAEYVDRRRELYGPKALDLTADLIKRLEGA